MEDKFYKFYINKVSKKSITLVCADKKCKTAQKIILDEQFVKCEVNGLKNGDKFRNKFYIDNSDLELRNLKNWTVISHKTLPHSCTIKQTFYDHLHTSFRENHTDLNCGSTLNVVYRKLLRQLEFEFFCMRKLRGNTFASEILYSRISIFSSRK